MMMTSGAGVHYKSMFDAGSQIVAREGVKSLFKGAGANILRGVAGAGVLSLYDKLQQVMFGKVYSGGKVPSQMYTLDTSKSLQGLVKVISLYLTMAGRIGDSLHIMCVPSTSRLDHHYIYCLDSKPGCCSEANIL